MNIMNPFDREDFENPNKTHDMKKWAMKRFRPVDPSLRHSQKMRDNNKRFQREQRQRKELTFI